MDYLINATCYAVTLRSQIPTEQFYHSLSKADYSKNISYYLIQVSYLWNRILVST